MYYLNKIIGWAASPLGVLFLGLAVGCAFRKRGKIFGRVVVALALAQAWIFSCGVTTSFIGVPLEGEEPAVQPSTFNLQPVSAIVLLGGGMGIHEQCGRPEIYAGADRVWTAARLWREVGGIVTVSGGGAKGEMAFLTDMGVDTNRIVMIESARNTEEEARLIKEKISAVQPPTSNLQPKIALVTSAWHMPRAKMLFERVGFEVIPVPTDYEMHCAAESPLRFGDFLPNAEALVRNSYAVKEWVARFCYWLQR